MKTRSALPCCVIAMQLRFLLQGGCNEVEFSATGYLPEGPNHLASALILILALIQCSTMEY